MDHKKAKDVSNQNAKLLQLQNLLESKMVEMDKLTKIKNKLDKEVSNLDMAFDVTMKAFFDKKNK